MPWTALEVIRLIFSAVFWASLFTHCFAFFGCRPRFGLSRPVRCWPSYYGNNPGCAGPQWPRSDILWRLTLALRAVQASERLRWLPDFHHGLTWRLGLSRLAGERSLSAPTPFCRTTCI